MGRPAIKITTDVIKALAAHDCNRKEMAAHLDVSYATLRRRFDDHTRKDTLECLPDCSACAFEMAEASGRSKGDAMLRQKLFRMAASGNTAAIIFLAKNRLGYTDRQEITDKRDQSLVGAVAQLASLGLEELQRRRSLIQVPALPAAPTVIDAEIVKPKKGKKQHAKTGTL